MDLEQAIERVSKPPALGVRWDARDCEAGRLVCAQIAALTERLRIVEAERDEAKAALSTEREMREAAESYIRAIPAMCNGDYSSPCALHVRAPIEALRAELERKDAALKACDAFVSPKSSWARGAAELSEQIRAALQPKDKPCQTA